MKRIVDSRKFVPFPIRCSGTKVPEETLDRYLPGLMAVIYGGKTPVEAVAEIEESEE
jgi:hypothetical protein